MKILETLCQLMSDLPGPILLQQVTPRLYVVGHSATPFPLEHQEVLPESLERVQHPHHIVVDAHPHDVNFVLDFCLFAEVRLPKRNTFDGHFVVCALMDALEYERATRAAHDFFLQRALRHRVEIIESEVARGFLQRCVPFFAALLVGEIQRKITRLVPKYHIDAVKCLAGEAGVDCLFGVYFVKLDLAALEDVDVRVHGLFLVDVEVQFAAVENGPGILVVSGLGQK